MGTGATCTETYGQSMLKKDLNLKQMVGCYFFALWVRANVQSKIWAQGRKKRSARIPSDSQQKHGRKTTQHVNSVAVVKSPVNDDDRRHR